MANSDPYANYTQEVDDLIRDGNKPEVDTTSQAYLVARQMTDTMKEREAKAAELFILNGVDFFWFVHEELFKPMGYVSPEDWAANENLSVSTLYSGSQTIDVLLYFFDIHPALLKMVGEKKMKLILPACEKLRDDALEYARASDGMKLQVFARCQKSARRWVKDAINLPYTALIEKREGFKGWEKYHGGKHTFREMVYAPLLEDGHVVRDDEGNVILVERTATQLLEHLGVGADVQDKKLRVTIWGPKKKETHDDDDAA